MKITILTTFIFILSFCNAQNANKEFCGIIEYEVQNNNSIRFNDSYSLAVNKEIIYYKSGKIKLEEYIDNDLVKSFYYYPDSSVYYKMNSCQDVVLKMALKEKLPFEIEKSNQESKILNHTCSQVKITPEESYHNREYIEYSPDIHLNFWNNRFFSNTFLYEVKSFYLKYEYVNKDGKPILIKTATKIQNIELSDSVFIYPETEKDNYTPNNHEFWEVGNELMSCGKLETAIKLYGFALKVRKDNHNMRYNRAICNLKLDNNLQACNDLHILKNFKDEAATKLHNSLCNCKSLRPYYYKELVQSINNNDYKKSIRIFNSVINCNEKDTNALFNRAISKFNNKQDIEAFEDILMAKKLGDSDATELIENKFDKEKLSKAYFILGNKYLDNKEYDKALNSYTIILNSFPNSVATLKKRGMAYIKLKNRDNACIDFFKAAESNDEEAIKFKKRYCKK